jgi:Spy/CpxP family protein refolding chaperone
MTGAPSSSLRSSRWKPAAILAAVFLFGGVAGVAIGRMTAIRDLQSTFRGPPTEARAHFRLEAMRRHLDLTDDQVRRLEVVFSETEAEREKLLDACRPGLDALRDQTTSRVNEILTPEQKARHEELEAERKKRHPRGPGRRDRDPGGGHGP